MMSIEGWTRGSDMRRWFIVILAFIIVICSGINCSTDNFTTRVNRSGDSPQASWTIFVYGLADNNLTNSFLADLDKMTQASLSTDIKIVVMADWDASYEIGNTGQKFPKGTEWYLVKGNGSKELIARDEEQNLDEPETLAKSIARAYQMFPAKRYGLILWDHGGSWDGGYGSDEQDGELDSPRGMTVPELSDAIRSGLKQANISGDRPLEFLGFDTCLMGGAEVAYTMRDLCKVYIANAEIDYGSGWNYTDVFTALAQKPGMTAPEFAKLEVATWDNLHKAASSSDVFLRSHIAIDTQYIDAFAGATADLVSEILKTERQGNATSAYEEELARIASITIPSYSMFLGRKAIIPKYRDFGELLADIENQPQLGDIAVKAGVAKKALEAMIIGNVLGELRSHQYGLSIGLPQINSIDEALLHEYTSKAASWSDKTGWGNMLAELAADVPSQGPKVNHTLENNGQPSTAGVVSIQFSTPTSSACTVTMELIGPDPITPADRAYYGTVINGVIQPGQAYRLDWTGKSWTIGTLKQRVAVIPWVITENDINNSNYLPSLLGAYGRVKASDGAFLPDAVLIFSGDNDYADEIAFEMPNGSWTASPLKEFVHEFPDATFFPALMGWNSRTGSEDLILSDFEEKLPESGHFPVQAASVPAGDYVLVTICTDVWGVQTMVTDDVKVNSPF